MRAYKQKVWVMVLKAMAFFIALTKYKKKNIWLKVLHSLCRPYHKMLHCRQLLCKIIITKMFFLLDKITSYTRHYPSSFPIIAQWQGFPSCVIIGAWGNSAEQSASPENASITNSSSHPDSSAWRQQKRCPTIRTHLNSSWIGPGRLRMYTVGNYSRGLNTWRQ